MLQKTMERGGAPEIVAPYDMGDVLQSVIVNDGEVLGRIPRFPSDQNRIADLSDQTARVDLVNALVQRPFFDEFELWGAL